MKILVVVPAFNEAENMVTVISDLREHFPRGDIVVINDGSLDNTSHVARSLGIRVIDIPSNLGIGGAVQTGFKFAFKYSYDVVVQFDGDGQHMAEEIEKILKPVHEGIDLVIGSRFLVAGGYNMPLTRRTGSTVFSWVISLVCQQKLSDTTSGFRAYGKKVINLFSSYYPEDYPEVEALIVAHKNQLKIREVPVHMRQRAGGKSSITALLSVYYMVKVLLAIFIDVLKRSYIVK